MNHGKLSYQNTKPSENTKEHTMSDIKTITKKIEAETKIQLKAKAAFDKVTAKSTGTVTKLKAKLEKLEKKAAKSSKKGAKAEKPAKSEKKTAKVAKPAKVAKKVKKSSK